MNNLNLYSVFDTKSKLYAMPHFQSSDGVAIRAFSSACEDPKTELNKYSEDFSLYCLGSFDIESGKLESLEVPKHLCNAAEFNRKEDS